MYIAIHKSINVKNKNKLKIQLVILLHAISMLS